MLTDILSSVRRQVYLGDLAGAWTILTAFQVDGNADTSELQALAGLIQLRLGRFEPGRASLDKALAVEPGNSAWAADLGGGVLVLGDIHRALEYLRLAVTMPNPDATAFNRLGAVLMTVGDLAGAEEYFRQALVKDQNYAAHHLNLGNLLVQSGRSEEALECLEKALAIDKDFELALQARNQLLVTLDRADVLIGELEARLADEPDSLPIRRNLADLLDADGRFQEGVAMLREAAKLNPENVEILLQLARMLAERFRNRPALAVLRKAEELEPERQAVLVLLARTLVEAGNNAKAEEVVEKLFEFHPRSPQSFLTRATVRAAGDDPDGAEADMRQALEIMPGSVEALGNLGHHLMQQGRMEEAVDCFKRAAAINPPALAALIEARSFPDDPRIIALMQEMAANLLLPKGPRTAISFALAKLFERRQEYDLAFTYADQANAQSRKTMLNRGNQHHRLVVAMVQVFTKEFHDRFRGYGSRSERPVFVVGMPRSGTTLTEQMLSSHPEVFGGGELGFIPALVRLMPEVLKSKAPYPGCLKGLKQWMPAHAASYYLSKIAKLDDQAGRVVDKLPHNFLHLGLINLVFPRARIIHIRRDLRDVAVSNYFTNFKHKHGGMAYAFDLEDIGRMLNDYRRIMDHWRQVLPPGVIFELNYEDLVERPEEMGRRLCEFLDLPWDERLLDSHHTERAVKTASVWQVRQPIYQSSKERWRNYEQHLEPLNKILEEYPPRFG